MPDKSKLIEDLKNRLEDFRFTEEDLDYQQERLERLNSKMLEVGAQVITDMPRSPSPEPDRMTDYIVRKNQLMQDISSMLERHQEEREIIETILNKSLRKPSRRAVIRIRYLDAGSWNDVVDTMYGGKGDFREKEETYLRGVFRIRDEAISDMAEFIASTTDKRILKWIT